MAEYPLLWEWLSFGVRWLHVITAIAWIGSSFYFIALDLGLRKAPDLPAGAHGEEWQVHGGGFYHIQKYLVAPERLPEHLTWFKWESYVTWLSGFALLCVVYYAGADLYLVDPSVRDLTSLQAIGLSLGSIALGWLLYDLLCRSPLGRNSTGLMLMLFVILVVLGWGFTQVFSGRAALLHLGAVTATIMSANVFMVIIPNQKKVVAVLKQGGTPDPRYGVIAKQRSTHNNYLTLPVIFLMLSNHYPLAFATPYNWVIAALVFLTGVTIRHFFNTMHKGGGRLWWTWAATAVLFAAAVWLSSFPATGTSQTSETAAGSAGSRFASAAGFDDVTGIVQSRCSMCHASEPGWEGIIHAPKGVLLETPEQIAAEARAIFLQSGHTRAMPPANVSFMEDGERKSIVEWYQAALAKTEPGS
jgi:uncharacterized membrane protein